MCSRSMFVMTARMGESFRNERSLSSASATRYCERPRRAFEPIASTRPPTTTVGSSPPAASTAATIEVVVVLPCIPAIAIPYFRRINSANISARGITGICRRSASETSALALLTAELVTTTSAVATFSAACASKTVAPSVFSRSVTAERFRSDPETLYPRFSMISAMPLMPIPPMPTKWMRWILANIKKC